MARDDIIDSALLDWLLDSDPALRWQVERDLADQPEEVWVATRARVATEGFGAALSDGVAPDERLAEAIEVIRAARQPDGTWIQERRHPGRVWFEIDVPAGEPSPWLTFYATRALRWWDQAR